MIGQLQPQDFDDPGAFPRQGMRWLDIAPPEDGELEHCEEADFHLIIL